MINSKDISTQVPVHNGLTDRDDDKSTLSSSKKTRKTEVALTRLGSERKNKNETFLEETGEKERCGKYPSHDTSVGTDEFPPLLDYMPTKFCLCCALTKTDIEINDPCTGQTSTIRDVLYQRDPPALDLNFIIRNGRIRIDEIQGLSNAERVMDAQKLNKAKRELFSDKTPSTSIYDADEQLDSGVKNSLSTPVAPTCNCDGSGVCVPAFREWDNASFIEELLVQLVRREVFGSHKVGRRVCEVLRRLVEACACENTYQLLQIVKHVGKHLIRANHMEVVVANVVRRVLCIIRTEHYKHLDIQRNSCFHFPRELQGASSSFFPTASLHDSRQLRQAATFNKQSLCSQNSSSSHYQQQNRLTRRAAPSMAMYFDPDAAAEQHDLLLPVSETVKHSILEGISELLAEIDSPWEDEEARSSFFLPGEIILVYGYSLAVERLLKGLHLKFATALSNRRESQNQNREGAGAPLQILLLAGDTEDGSFKMAHRLAASGINVTVVSDGSLFCVMNKVDKVIMGTVAVLSSGGAVTVSGGHQIALVASSFSVPCILVSPLFKFTYLPIVDHLRQTELLSPSFMSPEFEVLRNVSVQIPLYDHIPCELIKVVITDIGPIDPSNLHTLAMQRYHLDDLDLITID